MNTIIWLTLVFSNPVGMSVDFIPFPDVTHCNMARERAEGLVGGNGVSRSQCLTNEQKEAVQAELTGTKLL